MEWIVIIFVFAIILHWNKSKTDRQTSLNQKKVDLSSIKLSTEQKELFDKINSSNDHILVTGKAGTGKSSLLQYLKHCSSKNLVVVAPTGVAALNVQGQTIHSFFKIPPSFNSKGILILDDRRKLVLKNIDAVVIDEVSMVRADLMDTVDRILKHARSSQLPFGGVQMIMFGDMYQLPPVVEDPELFKYFSANHGGFYFFNAHVWHSANLKIYQLKTIFRQKDEKFKRILNAIRTGKISNNILNELNSRVIQNPPTEDMLTLAITNQSVSEINHHRLDALDEKLYEYKANMEGRIENSFFPTEETLYLKKGAQVMLVKNDTNKRWVNGTVGHIHSLRKNEIEVDIDGNIYSIPQDTWKRIQYIYNEEEGIIDEETISSFTQFPIKLAWAVTIHKSQGQTYNSVIIDMGSGAFAHGQTYVALSRCTSLKGIHLKRRVLKEDIIIDPAIINFMRFGKTKSRSS